MVENSLLVVQQVISERIQANQIMLIDYLRIKGVVKRLQKVILHV